MLGFSYDVFTFSMVANMVRMLLARQGVAVYMGSLKVNVGSFHIYEKHFADAEFWLSCYSADTRADQVLRRVYDMTTTIMPPQDFIGLLRGAADES